MQEDLASHQTWGDFSPHELHLWERAGALQAAGHTTVLKPEGLPPCTEVEEAIRGVARLQIPWAVPPSPALPACSTTRGHKGRAPLPHCSAHISTKHCPNKPSEAQLLLVQSMGTRSSASHVGSGSGSTFARKQRKTRASCCGAAGLGWFSLPPFPLFPPSLNNFAVLLLSVRPPFPTACLLPTPIWPSARAVLNQHF